MADNLQVNTLPTHVGIIMDGNGRWATERGFSRLKGHLEGAQAFGRAVRHAKKRGIKYLTVYAFSTENWGRPREEVRGLMNLLRGYLKDVKKYHKENVRIKVLGDISALDEDLQDMIFKVEKSSGENTGINVNIALNYGGRDEIAHAARTVAKKILGGEIALQQIDEAMLDSCMYTAGQPAVDLVIRTGGEKRISNFLLWQSAYAELVFCEVYWPAFGPEAFDAALTEFDRRNRRMGKI